MMIKVTFENGKTDMFPMTAGVFVNANNELKKACNLVAGDVYMSNKIVNVEKA